MAINFGNTTMEGEITPSVQVQAPVQDDSGAILAQGFGPAARAIGAVAGTIFQNNQQDQSNAVLTRYENDLLDIADAVDQGKDTNWAMIQARALRRQYLANAPALQEDFDKIWTNFVDTNGLGNVVKAGTLEQQAEDAIATEAMKNNYPSVEAYKQFLANKNVNDALTQQLTNLQTNNQIIPEQLKQQALSSVTALASSAFPSAQKQINDAMTQIEANPANKAEIAQTTLTSLQQQVAQISFLGQNADTAFIVKPINDLMTSFQEWSTGTVETAVLENEIKYTENMYKVMAYSEPEIASFLASSSLLKSVGLENSNLATELITQSGGDFIKKLRDTMSGNVNILANTDDNEGFTQKLIELSQTDFNNDPAAVEEFKGVIASIVDGTYINERGAKDGALGFKGTVEVLGSPSMTEFIKANPDIAAQHADKFGQVIETNYEQEFIPAVQRYWESVPIQNPTAGERVTPSNIPMNQLLDVVWNGSAVEFVPKPEWADDPRIVSLASDVNTGSNSIGAPLNDLIRAHANVSAMSGTPVDPKTVWEQQFAGRIFGIGEEGEAPLVQGAVDGPSIEQFNAEDEVQFEQDAKYAVTPEQDPDLGIKSMDGMGGIDMSSLDPSQFIPPTSNPAVNPEVLARFEGKRIPVSIRNNNMGAVSIVGDVASSWAARQPGFVGVTARPANEGGYYAKYATPEHGVAAASNLLERYGEQGIDTPATIVRKWSTDTGAHNSYANTLVTYLKQAGVEASSTTHLDLNNPAIRIAILKAKSAHESGAGVPVYNDDVFVRGVNAQFGG